MKKKALWLVLCIVAVLSWTKGLPLCFWHLVKATPLPVAGRSFLQFLGTGREYFGIWIVNLVLCIITLGIYIPWARVRTRRYFYRNTLLDGHSFDYLADPKRLLIGYLIIGAFFVLYTIAGNIDASVALAVLGFFAAVFPGFTTSPSAFSRPTPPTAIFASASTAASKAPTSPSLAGRSSRSAPWACSALWPSSSRKNTSLTISPSAPSALSSAVALATFSAFSTRSASRSYCSLVPPYSRRGNPRRADAHLRRERRLNDYNGRSARTICMGLSSIPLAVYVIFLVLFAVWAVLSRSYCWNNTVVKAGPDEVRFESRLGIRRYPWISLSNIVLIIVTFGLFAPWAVVRMFAYRISCLSVHGATSLDDLVAEISAEPNAMGEAASDLFDFDFGL